MDEWETQLANFKTNESWLVEIRAYTAKSRALKAEFTI